MNNLNLIKWALEVTNQEGYKSPSELINAYNWNIRGY